MRLQVRRIDHQERWFATFARQFGKDLVEHTKSAPAHEPIVDGLVRTVLTRRIAPAQLFLMKKMMPLITRRSSPLANSVRQWKIRLDPAHLRLRQQQKITHGDASRHHH